MTIESRDGYRVGELLCVEPGYRGGIWLRTSPDEFRSKETDLVRPEELIVVLAIEGKCVRVMSGSGAIGWTWTSRLRKLMGI